VDGSGGGGRWRAERCSGARGREEKKEGEREGGRKEKEKEKRKWRERERETVGIAAATTTGLACAPVWRDARDAGEQEVGTAMDSDVGTGFSGVQGIGQGTILNGLSSTIEKRF